MLVFFLFCGKWLFAMKLVFLHFEFVFCVYFQCFYRLSRSLGTLSRLLGRLSRSLGLSPSLYLPYVICACRAPRDAVGPSFLLRFARFGCKNTLNSSIFVMKRENLLVYLKKVL